MTFFGGSNTRCSLHPKSSATFLGVAKKEHEKVCLKILLFDIFRVAISCENILDKAKN